MSSLRNTSQRASKASEAVALTTGVGCKDSRSGVRRSTADEHDIPLAYIQEAARGVVDGDYTAGASSFEAYRSAISAVCRKYNRAKALPAVTDGDAWRTLTARIYKHVRSHRARVAGGLTSQPVAKAKAKPSPKKPQPKPRAATRHAPAFCRAVRFLDPKFRAKIRNLGPSGH